ncbi:MAG: hypothetical protein WC308_04020 [archaeon]|jgi:hypothetical protein
MLGLKKANEQIKRGEAFLISGEEKVTNKILSLIHFKIFFRFKYPKIFLFALCIIFSYFIFSNYPLDNFLAHLGNWSYLGVLFAGVLFSFGFTSPFSAGLLIVMHPENIFLAAIIGGFGCLLGDMAIFKFVKFSFNQEFSRLKREKPFLFMKRITKGIIKPKLQNYLLFAFAGFFFASPLIPDEAAVTLLAGLSSMSAKKIAIISFICNTTGIFALLLL